MATPNKEEMEKLINKYALAATGEMIAIPLPVLDLATVFATWAKMIQDIGKHYEKDISLSDAKGLAWTFARNALSAGGAWFGSAAIAQTILKVFPLGGRLGAYLLDATVAGAAMGRLTRQLAKSAQEYFELTPEQTEKKKKEFDRVLEQVLHAGAAVANIVKEIRGK